MISLPYRREFCINHGVVVLEQNDRETVIGCWKAVPPALIRRLEAYHGGKVVLVSVQRDSPAVELALPEEEQSASIGEREFASTTSTGRTRNLPAGEALFRRLVLEARDRSATDISFWKVSPYQWNCVVRARGGTQPIATLSDQSARVMLRMVKAAAGLDTLDNRSPQNGSVTMPWLPDVTMRIATVGALNGEALAVRFLQREPLSLGALGLSAREITDVLLALAQPSGLIISCGPTGSGKTTTCAAMVEVLLRNHRKVVTVEEPVEYRIPGALQIPGDSPELLAAVLRQDPDVIWIGETRHRKHGNILAEALRTGHLILTSVHADSTEGALQRLRHLGVPGTYLSHVPIFNVYQQRIGNPPTLRTQIEKKGVKKDAHLLEGV
jgi:general secretion pathway protein E